LHHREIEHEDLHRLLSARPWPEVREGDLATVWAERYRDPRKADEEESCCTRGVPIDTEEWVAARGTKPVQIATIGAHDDQPLLRRRESRQWREHRKLIVHRESDTGSIGGSPEALERSTPHRETAPPRPAVLLTGGNRPQHRRGCGIGRTD